MKNFSRFVSACALLSGCAAVPLLAQDVPPILPNSMGFSLPTISGQLSYSVTVSQAYTHGYNGNQGNVSSTNVSGNLAYLSASETHPFAMIYSGGFLGSESSQQPSSTFQDLALSQSFRSRSDSFVIADTVNYLPQSPTTGLSGIAGVGDLGIGPVQVGGVNGPGILTQYARRVSNNLSASDTHRLTGKTALTATGSYAIQRFLYTDSLPYSTYDSDQEGASIGVNHRVDARNSFGVNYAYTHFSFSGQGSTFDSHGFNVEYIHRFSPRLVFDGSAGPQWNLSSTYPSAALSAAVQANLIYTGERGGLTAGYTRGSSTGFGVVQGAITDTAGVVARRNFSRVLEGALSFSYSHSDSLPSLISAPFSVNSEVAGAQVTRSIGPSFSVYASYTALYQQSNNNFLANTIALNGLTQTIGAGVTYSPRTRRFRQ